jgi:hypothetical protein
MSVAPAPPPGSERHSFEAMLARAGIPFARDLEKLGVGIVVDPEVDPHGFPALRGSHATAQFCFDTSGTLICVELSGDGE